MNRKGFTLVELLAVIVVLSIVMSISIVAIITSLNNAKKKTEKEFLNQISNAVDTYVNLCRGNMAKCDALTNFSSKVNDYIYYDCDNTNCSFGSDNSICTMCMNLKSSVKVATTIDKRNGIVNVYGPSEEMRLFDGILSANILTAKDLVNPVNNESCIGNNNNSLDGGSKITFYIDKDYVYYYKIELPRSCIQYNYQSDNDQYVVLGTLPGINGLSINEDDVNSELVNGGVNLNTGNQKALTDGDSNSDTNGNINSGVVNK